MLKILNVIPLLLVLTSCASKSINLVIFHTNDHHGHYWKDRHDQYGMAARLTLLKELRSKTQKNNGHSLLLSGGDINTGTIESDIYDAEPDFRGMNKLGYDAMAVGNHEFDNSIKTILWQQQLAGFPFLSANTRWKTGPNKGERVFNRPLYVVKKLNGIKVGIFGLTTSDTNLKASHDDSRERVYFTSIITEAKNVIEQMKKDGVDFIIVTTHVGHNGSSTADGDIQLAKAVEGIDVIVGGHSQEIVRAHEVNGAIIVQAHEWGKYVGQLNLAISKNSLGMVNKRLLSPYELIPVNHKEQKQKIVEDTSMLKILSPFYQGAQARASKIIGYSSGDFQFTYQNVRKDQTAMGQLVALAIQKKGKSDIAIINGGGIRGNIEVGPIRYAQVHAIHPYGNTIANVSMDHKELFQYIASNVKLFIRKEATKKGDLNGGYPQFAGVKLYIVNDKLVKMTSFSQNNYWEIRKDGKNLVVQGKDKFTISLSSFSAKGGDGLPDISKKSSFEDTGFTIDHALVDYLQNDLKSLKHPIDPKIYEASAKKILNF